MSEKRNNATHSVEQLLGSKFQRDRSREIGATDSAHETRIGEYGSIAVAAKPFFGNHAAASARAEYSLTQEVADQGFVTPEPFKVITHSRYDAAIYMSRYIPGITGLNSLRINDDLDSPRGKALIGTVSSLAILLGQYHDHGITHGDAQIKNFGILQKPLPTAPLGSLIGYDFEKGDIHDTSKKPSDSFKENAIADLGKVAYSLGYRNFGGYDPYTATDALHKAVFEPYVDQSPAEQRLGGEAVGDALDHAEAQFLKARKQAHRAAVTAPRVAA